MSLVEPLTSLNITFTLKQHPVKNAKEVLVENSVKLSTKVSNWLGVTGNYQLKPGEMWPLWYGVPKGKYLAISIPITIAAIALFLLLVHEGVSGSFAAIVAVQSFALALLIFERFNIKVDADHSEGEKDEIS